MKKLEEENKRLNAIIIALLKANHGMSGICVNLTTAKYIEFPIFTSMGLLHFKTESKNFKS